MSKGFSNYQTLHSVAHGNNAPNRHIQSRVDDYKLLTYLSKDSVVLDIGCNRGFFGIVLSNKIKTYIGIDHDFKQIKYGIEEVNKKILNNITLICKDFEHYEPNIMINVIFSFAVHAYIKMCMNDYAAKMYRLLSPGGLIVLESHPNGYMGEPSKLMVLKDLLEGFFGMERIGHKSIIDRTNNRELYIWKKQMT
jgi:cyclopropane fatty-acyl-phospholipid synthase-like methyltransferase